MEFWPLNDEISKMVAIMTARVILGLLFLFQGYDKIFRVGIGQVSNAVNTGIGNGFLSPKLVNTTVFISSWIELIAGGMMVLGIFKTIASVALCANLIVVTIGFSWSKPIWDEMHVFVRLSLLLLVMMLPTQWDQLSLDNLIK
ncbi:MAG: DoxX family protein [Bacteroidota bacterium]